MEAEFRKKNDKAKEVSAEPTKNPLGGGLSLYNYIDYRQYLRDFYSAQKDKNPNFSYRSFAMKARLTSPNYLKLVMDGQRPLTDRNLPFFVRGLRLDHDEEKYFRLLVTYTESADIQEKREVLSQILQVRDRKISPALKLELRQHDVLRHWANWVVREMVLLEGFQADGHWIADTLKRAITPKQAQDSLELLLDTGLLVKKEDGRLAQANARILSNDEVLNVLVRNLHAQMIELGLKSLFQDPIHVREFAGVTLALTEEQVTLLKERIKKFRQDINLEFSTSEAKAKTVYHFELMMFPITKGETKC